jgi:hypothetical protein
LSGVKRDGSFVIGDRVTDIEAPEAAGLPGFLFAGGDLDAFVADVLLQTKSLQNLIEARRIAGISGGVSNCFSPLPSQGSNRIIGCPIRARQVLTKRRVIRLDANSGPIIGIWRHVEDASSVARQNTMS